MATMIRSGRIQAEDTPIGIDWAVASKPKLAHDPCGDGYLIRRAGPRLLFAVADGSGSGRRAADASGRCLAALCQSEAGSIEGYFPAAHAALVGSCGAALGLAMLDPRSSQLDWASIGDIDALLLRGNGAGMARVLQRGGTLGFSMPAPACQSHGVDRGDTLIMVTDGITRGFRSRTPRDDPATLAALILNNHGRAADDSLVLVARMAGAQ